MSEKKHQTVTAQDVANKAGVSRAAVSRTLTNNGSVSQATREKVQKAAEELGYQVNFLAQGLNRKRSQLIGVVVAHLSDPFRSSLLEGLLTEIQQQGYQALVTEVTSQQDLTETIRRFTQFRVSGVIVTSGQPPVNLIKECVQHNIPVVGINRHMALPEVDFVCSDNSMGATLAADQLIRSGCQTIGWLNYKHSTWSGVSRGNAFRQTIDDRRLQQNEALRLLSIEAPEEGYQGGRIAAHRIFQSGQTIDGLFCANAQLACGYLDGMREQGLDAPHDFHLIGFDDTPLTAQYSYQLTTISQNIKETALRALSCLEARGRDATKAQQLERIPVQLIVRKTSPSIASSNNK
ncbi:HTH-type transcriptional regulator DegA [Marinomonas spartinae]|uniref:HTH-type transcriptional regulator DegA n=1 Tax=Marinomonas spartinae TaxID=1792290 RepID=A0A1A8T1R4_9GAMM|nr:LacI family DNA-binding transcriptional regulator [Marinomonas spartinae]SBS25619.1 HTH-type transcriptional regulator DegA [Marinomonas spartinae]